MVKAGFSDVLPVYSFDAPNVEIHIHLVSSLCKNGPRFRKTHLNDNFIVVLPTSRHLSSI